MPELRKVLVVSAFVLLFAAAVFAWVDVVQTLRHTTPVTPATVGPGPDAIVWGNRVFGSPHELERWLHSRGASYSHWRKRFPADARVLEHLPPRPTTTASASHHTATTTSTEATHAAATAVAGKRTAAPRDAANGGARRGLLLWFLVLAAIGTLAAIASRIHRES